MRLRRTISCSLAIPAVPPEARDQSAHDSGSWPRRVCEILMQRFTLARRWYQAWLPRTMRCSSFCIFWRTSLSLNNAISVFRIVAGRYCRACTLAASAASSARCCPWHERRASSCPLATRQTGMLCRTFAKAGRCPRPFVRSHFCAVSADQKHNVACSCARQALISFCTSSDTGGISRTIALTAAHTNISSSY